MKIYNITVGQLVVLWIFGLLAWITIFLYSTDSFTPPSGLGVAMWFLIPFALIFYTIGWRNWKKMDKDQTTQKIKEVRE